MEYIFYLFIALAALYFIGSLGDKSPKKKSSSISISNFIDNSKQYADMQECVDIIGNYLYQNGIKNYQEAAERFPNFIEKLVKAYEKEKKDWNKELASTEQWLEDKLIGLEDEQDKKDTIEDTKPEIRGLKKIVGWYDREVQKVKKDMKHVMKKYMTNYAKTDDVSQLWDLGLPKELPDSYHDY
tara:strand:- start:45 stop:596 length:552 start_codon:yes stop_codon:yes gene_type:complete